MKLDETAINPHDISESTRAAIDRLSEEAGHLKKLSQLNFLKTTQVETSVDTAAILETYKEEHHRGKVGDLRELIDLIDLLASDGSRCA